MVLLSGLTEGVYEKLVPMLPHGAGMRIVYDDSLALADCSRYASIACLTVEDFRTAQKKFGPLDNINDCSLAFGEARWGPWYHLYRAELARLKA